MIVDAHDSDVPLDRQVEVLIIGGGVAGITLARKLGKHHQVLLLESGGESPDPEIQSLYQGKVVGLDYSLEGSRLRFLGGTSNHWGGWCGQFDPLDFELRDWVSHSGWPIGQDDIEPYYQETANILNLERPALSPDDLERDARIESMASDPNVVLRVFRFSSPVVRMGEKYRDELEASTNIEVLLHANAIELRLDEQGKRVRDVVVRTLSGRTGTVSGQTIILCCGGIENARLLLASRHRSDEGVGNQNGLVGRYFMEHPHMTFAELLPHDLDWCNAQMALRRDGEHWYGFGLSLSDRAVQEYRCLNMSSQFFNKACDKGQTITISAMWEQAPNPGSRVRLADEVDALQVPRVILDWNLTDLDFHSMRQGALTLAHALGSNGLGRLKLGQWVVDGHTDAVHYGSHHMGTTRMADAPENGVVDSNSRVFGIDNLYIAGSSVFTTSGPINPTFTLTALTLRLAHYLEDRLA